MNENRFSRRRLLQVSATAVAGVLGAAALAGCDIIQPAAPTPAPAPAPGVTPVAPPAPPAVRPKVSIWRPRDFSMEVNDYLRPHWDQFAEANNIEIEFEEKTSGYADLIRAAVHAGDPPDIGESSHTMPHYWRGLGAVVDITDVVEQYSNAEGGFFEGVALTISWQGKYHASPLGISPWPWHTRQDWLDEHNNGEWCKDWDEMREVGRRITSPPTYAYGMTLGPCEDTNNHFFETLWTFGGKLQNEDSTLGITEDDDAVLATIDLVQKMYSDDAIIPPGSISWDDGDNNTNYQGGLSGWTSNPPSIWAWLTREDPELLAKTSLYYPPAGPAGQFAMYDARCQVLFKDGKGDRDWAKAALEATIEPTWYATYIEQLDGRFTHVYKNMIERPYYDRPGFREMAFITKNGRIVSYAASPTAPVADVNSRYLASTMLVSVLAQGVSPKDALKEYVAQAKAIYADYPEL